MDPSEVDPVVGWREWVALPGLGVARIKAKIDTGARSSSLHVFDVETEDRAGRTWVRFAIHPRQRDDERIVRAEAEVVEHREVRSSSGHASVRPVVLTEVVLLGRRWPIELTLANRDAMGFRMLLGRQALAGRVRIDPGRSYVGGRLRRRKKNEGR